MDKGLCQRCAGNYMPDKTQVKRRKKAVLVHHHFPAEDYPEYVYSIYVEKDGQRIRNLYSLCTACHEYIHRDTHRPVHRKKKEDDSVFTTEERWD